MKITRRQLKRIIREAIEASTSPPEWNAPIADLEAWWRYELGDPDVSVERRTGRATFIGTGGMMSRGDALPVMTVKSNQFEGGYLELTPLEWSQIASSWKY